MRRYLRDDYNEIAQWHRDHAQKPPRPDTFPAIGFIEPGVAAGFLYQTDSVVVILEGFIANPKCDATLRDEALDEIVKSLLSTAAAMSYKIATASSKVPAIQARARKHKFLPLGTYEVLKRDI